MTRMRGAFPSPRHKLAAAVPHIAVPAPANFLWKPVQLSMWGNDVDGDCVTAEEAAAKACAPGVFISDDEVIAWATAKGYLNGAVIVEVAEAMAAAGFVQGGKTYDDGPVNSVDWTNPTTLQSAISQGPVKIGVASDQLETACPETVSNGWFALGFKPDQNYDHCVGLIGYGTIEWLAQQFGVEVPARVDGSQLGYALFTWSSVGIIDVPSLLAICSEAWLRTPTTVVKL